MNERRESTISIGKTDNVQRYIKALCDVIVNDLVDRRRARKSTKGLIETLKPNEFAQLKARCRASGLLCELEDTLRQFDR